MYYKKLKLGKITKQITTNELQFVSGLNQSKLGNVSAVCTFQNGSQSKRDSASDRSSNHHAEAQGPDQTAPSLGGTKLQHLLMVFEINCILNNDPMLPRSKSVHAEFQQGSCSETLLEHLKRK